MWDAGKGGVREGLRCSSSSLSILFPPPLPPYVMLREMREISSFKRRVFRIALLLGGRSAEGLAHEIETPKNTHFLHLRRVQ